MAFVDTLMDIGDSLKNLPPKQRVGALDNELGRVNRMLLRRMQTRGANFMSSRDRAGSYTAGAGNGASGREWLNERDVAAVCPEVSHHALHLPIKVLKPGHPAATRAVRVLRLCRELCRVLPSKERAPYLVVAEVLQTPFSYASDRLYLEGGNSGVTCEDVVNKRTLPQALQEELLRSRGQDVWEEPEESALQLRHVELEVADRSFFDRATSQYLTAGDPSSHHVKNMREALQVFGTTSVALERMVRHQSPFGHLKGWQLAHFIVKAGDDFRMEALAMQVKNLELASLQMKNNIFPPPYVRVPSVF
ncbi:unnamed protein product [Laminaria digitata]